MHVAAPAVLAVVVLAARGGHVRDRVAFEADFAGLLHHGQQKCARHGSAARRQGAAMLCTCKVPRLCAPLPAVGPAVPRRLPIVQTTLSAARSCIYPAHLCPPRARLLVHQPNLGAHGIRVCEPLLLQTQMRARAAAQRCDWRGQMISARPTSDVSSPKLAKGQAAGAMPPARPARHGSTRRLPLPTRLQAFM